MLNLDNPHHSSMSVRGPLKGVDLITTINALDGLIEINLFDTVESRGGYFSTDFDMSCFCCFHSITQMIDR